MFFEFLEQNAGWVTPLALGLGVVLVGAHIFIVRSITTESCRKCRTSNPLEASVCRTCGGPLPLPKFYPWNLLVLPAMLLGFFTLLAAIAGAATSGTDIPREFLAYAIGGLALVIASPVAAAADRTRRTSLKRQAILLEKGFYGGICSACGTEILGGMPGCQNCGQPVDSRNPNWTAPAKAGEISPPAEMKILCRRCGVENLPTAVRCSQCKRDLLGYKPVWERVAVLVTSLLASAFFGWLLFKVAQSPSLNEVASFLGIGVIGLGLMTVITPFYGLYQALARGPLHEMLKERAERHKTKSPWQALSDYSLALVLAPPEKHQDLIKRRIQLYRSLGLEKNATRDELALTYAREKDPQGGVGLFLGEKVFSLAGPTNGFSQGYLGQVVKEARSQREAMFLAGRVIAAAWCPTCKEVVVLKDRLICPHAGESGAKAHPRRLRHIQYVVPPDLEAGKARVPKVIAAEKKRRLRRAWVTATLVIGGLLVIYLLPVLLD